jgi:hypothetical protein
MIPFLIEFFLEIEIESRGCVCVKCSCRGELRDRQNISGKQLAFYRRTAVGFSLETPTSEYIATSYLTNPHKDVFCITQSYIMFYLWGHTNGICISFAVTVLHGSCVDTLFTNKNESFRHNGEQTYYF